MRRARIFWLALLFGPSVCFAEASNYDFAQVGFNSTSVDISGVGGDIEHGGFEVKGSLNFYENWYAAASYNDITSDDPVTVGATSLDAEQEFLTASIGYIFGSNSTGSVYGEFGFADLSITPTSGLSTASNSDSGFIAGLGFRGNFGEQAEIRVGLNYFDVDIADDTFASVDLVYHFFRNPGPLDNISGVITYNGLSDADSIVLSLRLEF